MALLGAAAAAAAGGEGEGELEGEDEDEGLSVPPLPLLLRATFDLPSLPPLIDDDNNEEEERDAVGATRSPGFPFSSAAPARALDEEGVCRGTEAKRDGVEEELP